MGVQTLINGDTRSQSSDYLAWGGSGGGGLGFHDTSITVAKYLIHLLDLSSSIEPCSKEQEQ